MFLLFIVVGALFIVIFSAILYPEKVASKVRERRDQRVLDAMHDRLIEKRVSEGDMGKFARIGICLIEYDALSKIYPLNNPMKYIEKAIQKANS